MNKLQKIFQLKKNSPDKPDNKYTINGKVLTISAVSFDELLEVVFLFIPYIKAIKTIQSEYKSDGDAYAFFDVVESAVTQMRYQDLNRCLQILLRESEESVKDLTVGDVIKILPIIIKENDLISVYFAMKSLGMYD